MTLLSPTRKQVADWARLSQKKFRRESGLFLIEGEVCVREALKAKAVDCLLVLSSEEEEWGKIVEKSPRTLSYRLTTDAYRRISQVETSQGLAAVGKQFVLKPRKTNLAMLVEQVSDPGNCGALIRVADFFGLSELYLGPGSADKWNDKVVRGSMGSLFHQPVKDLDDVAEFIQKWKGDSVALVAHNGEPLNKSAAFKPPTLLVFGNETRGLSQEIESLCTHRVTLEPHGDAESLNLVTAAAVASYATTQMMIGD